MSATAKLADIELKYLPSSFKARPKFKGVLTMSLNISNRYDDIINRPRPETKHPHMNTADRAKIFSPFAALKGHTEAIQRKEIHRTNRIDLSDEMISALNEKLALLKKGQSVTVTYFSCEPGPDGSGDFAEGLYLTHSGTVQKIDTLLRTIEIDNYRINFDDIIDITCSEHSDRT